jgi:hypothetical protein
MILLEGVNVALGGFLMHCTVLREYLFLVGKEYFYRDDPDGAG